MVIFIIQLGKMHGAKLFFMNKTVFLALLAGLISVSHVKAQDKIPGQPMPLFQTDEILNIDLEADFKTVFSVKDDSTMFPAKFTLTDNSGQKRTIDIKIRTRGKTRREKDVCVFTPLLLDFPKSATKNTPFEGQKALKLVTHCTKDDHYEQNTIVEFLIYKSFNVLTDSSFNVSPAMINYIYSGKNADTVQKFAFFLEREKFLAERLQGIEIESEKIHPNNTNTYHTSLMDMFQFMIGNTDYSTYDLHNIVLVSDSARKLPPVAIPYDFDWSGLVDADYAVPNPVLNIEKVTDRIYRGFRKEPEMVNHTIGVFNSKKPEIYRLFENCELLNNYRKKKAIEYLDGFYWTINNDKMVQYEFFDNARKVHE
jgi:hypothetical protein